MRGRSSLPRTRRRRYPSTRAPSAWRLEGRWWISTPGLSRAGGAGGGGDRVDRRGGGIAAWAALAPPGTTRQTFSRFRRLPCSGDGTDRSQRRTRRERLGCYMPMQPGRGRCWNTGVYTTTDCWLARPGAFLHGTWLRLCFRCPPGLYCCISWWEMRVNRVHRGTRGRVSRQTPTQLCG